MSKQVEGQMSELNAKIEEQQRTISDLNNQKGKLQNEAADLSRQLEEAEHQIGQLQKQRQQIQNQLEEAKRSLEDETRVSWVYLSVNTTF